MNTSSIVAKSSSVLDVICASAVPLSFTHVVASTGLPKSSTHRILSILAHERLIEFDARRQSYRPGPRLVGWAANTLSVNGLVEISADAMEVLNTATGAHVALSVLDANAALYLKTVDSIEPYRLAPRVGERSPVHACAAGKVLLAYLRPARREAILSELRLERYTEFTLTQPDALTRQLEQIRQDGLAICDREEFLQVAGIAAPVFDHHAEAVAAISLWNTVEQQSIPDLLEQKSDLLAATRGLSARLGYSD